MSDVKAIVAGRHSDPFAHPRACTQVGRRSGWRAPSFPTRRPVSALAPCDNRILGELTAGTTAGFFEGLVTIDRPTADQLPCPQWGRRMGRARPLQLRSGARADGRLLHRRGRRTCGSSTSSAPMRWSSRASTARILRSGRPMRSASAWSGRSTSGTGGAIRCGCGSIPASGKCSSPMSGRARSTNTRSSGRTASSRPLKADPFARQSELRPKTASVVTDPDALRLDRRRVPDAARAKKDWRRKPVSIYEVHLGSWRRRADGIVHELRPAGRAARFPTRPTCGFTHIELLPITEHPFDPSWGYQPTGLYAPTARFGDPAGFARFVDAAHAGGPGRHPRLGAGAFPDRRAWAGPLRRHGALRAYSIRGKGYHPDWNTAIYNFGRKEVVSFLVNNALYWLEKFHLDGLRVDAVASMLYLDYSREAGRVGAQPVRRQPQSRSRRVPQARQHGGLPAASGRHDDRRGVDLLARRVARRCMAAGWASASSGTWAS